MELEVGRFGSGTRREGVPGERERDLSPGGARGKRVPIPPTTHRVCRGPGVSKPTHTYECMYLDMYVYIYI